MPTKAPVHPIALKVITVAQMLDVSRQHVYHLIERGALRRIEMKGSTAVRVPASDVYDLLGLPYPDGLPCN